MNWKNLMWVGLVLMVGCGGGAEKEYREMLKGAKELEEAYPGFSAHFPESVPGNAQVTKVFFQSGWGSRCAARFEGKDGGFVEQTRRRYVGNDFSASSSTLTGMVVWNWLAPALKLHGDAKGYDNVELKSAGNDNHAYRAGVSVSRGGRDVVYWAERH